MRKLMRSMARAKMRKAGYRRINKPMPGGGPSYFARRWREWAVK